MLVSLAENDPNPFAKWQLYKDDIRFRDEVLPSWRRRLGKYKRFFLLNREMRFGAEPGI